MKLYLKIPDDDEPFELRFVDVQPGAVLIVEVDERELHRVQEMSGAGSERCLGDCMLRVVPNAEEVN